MKRLMILVGTAALLVASLVTTQSAFAHVLIMDTTGSVGAILHIIPDDDPIAGEESDIYFDRQGAESDDATVELSVANNGGELSEVNLTTTGSLSTGAYTFPAQGVYKLTFTVKSGEGSYTFEQSQRVARGVMISGAQTQQYPWAEALLVGSTVSFLALIVLVINRRKEIAQQSTY